MYGGVNRYWRLSKDDELLPQTSEAVVCVVRPCKAELNVTSRTSYTEAASCFNRRGRILEYKYKGVAFCIEDLN
jgi:hypothetical protein